MDSRWLAFLLLKLLTFLKFSFLLEKKQFMPTIFGLHNFRKGKVKGKIGTSDKARHPSVFIDFGVYISPVIEKDNYKHNVGEIERMFRKSISDNVVGVSFLENNFILNFEVPKTGLTPGRNVYLSTQVFLKCLPETKDMTFDTLSDMMMPMAESLADSIESIVYQNEFVTNKSRRAI